MNPSLFAPCPLTAPAALIHAAGADAVAEVLEWANGGVGADQAACAWLAQLRLGAALGMPVTSSAPPQLPRPFDDDVARALREAQPAEREQVSPGAVAELFPRWAESLRADRMGTRSHPLTAVELDPELTDDAALLRALPLAFIEHLDPETIYAMALENAAVSVSRVDEQHLTAARVATLASALSAGHPGQIVTSAPRGASLSTPLARDEATKHLPSGRLLEVCGPDAAPAAFDAWLSRHRAPEGDSASRAVLEGVLRPALQRLESAVNPGTAPR